MVENPVKFTTKTNVKKKYAESINKFYTNNSYFNMSNKDLIIEFGLQTPDIKEGDIVIENLAIMSLEQARLFSKTLANLIVRFDKERKEIEEKDESEKL